MLEHIVLLIARCFRSAQKQKGVADAMIKADFLLHGDRLGFMEKKRTNSGPLRKPADKHSIYTIKIH
jgi:hypothetical protein